MPSITRKKVSRQVYEQLVTMIQNGDFPANSKLPSEMELAKMFGVSRSPIREALSILAASGLIESQQGGGSWIKEVNLINMLEKVTFEMIEMDEVYQLLEMRTIIETEAAALAAERYQPQDLKEIEESLNAFRLVIHDEESIGYQEDYDFHRVIVKASYNPFLLQTIDNLSHLYQKALSFSLQKNIGIPRKREEVLQEHQKIYEAIRDRNPKKASEAMKHHLTVARKKLGDPKVKEL